MELLYPLRKDPLKGSDTDPGSDGIESIVSSSFRMVAAAAISPRLTSAHGLSLKDDVH